MNTTRTEEKPLSTGGKKTENNQSITEVIASAVQNFSSGQDKNRARS
jgi:hypothetical protein